MKYVYIEDNRHPSTKAIEYIITDNDCWNCISHSLNTHGYPQVTRDSKYWVMSRYIYTIEVDNIPNGLVVRHICDNPKCINPKHFKLGTQLDNIDDAIKRNRFNRGSKVPTSKLTEKTVELIKEEYLQKNITQQFLAEKYKISRSMISFIVNGIYWRHV
jgi:hypothetical protein